MFPMLLIEEPEAHLHPRFNRSSLAHIVSRVKKSRTKTAKSSSPHILPT